MTRATTLKLPETLKARIAAVARETGKTPHAFMLEALAAQTDLAERRRDFIATALAAQHEVAETGQAYEAHDVFGWLRATLAGEAPPTPQPVVSPKPRR